MLTSRRTAFLTLLRFAFPIIATSLLLPASGLSQDSEHLRRPPIEGAVNFRDLGGYRTRDGKAVKWHVLYRSDALNALTDKDLRYLSSLNIQKVVDFRQAAEVGKSPDKLPLAIVPDRANFPVALVVPKAPMNNRPAGAQLLPSEESAWLSAIDRALTTEAYPGFVRNYTPAYRAWMEGLLDTPHGAQLFHCTGGADRTGFAAALFLLAVGVPKGVVLDDYLLSNRYLFSPEGRVFLDKRTLVKLPVGLKLHARYLEAAFDEINKEYGSFDAYLRNGLSVDDGFRARLKDRYLE